MEGRVDLSGSLANDGTLFPGVQDHRHSATECHAKGQSSERFSTRSPQGFFLFRLHQWCHDGGYIRPLWHDAYEERPCRFFPASVLSAHERLTAGLKEISSSFC